MTPSQLASIIQQAHPNNALDVALEVVRCLHAQALGQSSNVAPIAIRSPATESPRTVLALVCAHFEYAPSDLTGPSRDKRLVHARKVCWALLRDRMKCSLTELGTMFHRDHTTIRISDKLRRDDRDYVVIAELLDAGRRTQEVHEAAE
jgi:hypothetical protein